MSSSFAIDCTGLTKDFGGNNGLFDCNLKIAEGEVFGLIGPNGAGKSTLLKLLMDLIKPGAGNAKIFGLDSQLHSQELKKEIGFLPGELMDFSGVSAGYILNLLLNLRGIESRSRLTELADRFQLDLNRKYRDLSHGNKQKVGLIQAFMHDPKLLILDEPTIGLDPIIQRELKLMVQESAASGKTVLLSSHVLSDIESVCTRIGLIIKGRIVREGTLLELRNELIHKVSVIFKGTVPSLSELSGAGAESISTNENKVNFEVRGSIDAVVKLLSKYETIEFDSRELSLEEVFFSEVAG